MRVKIPLRRDVFFVPQNFAFLDAGASSGVGYYIYEVQYSVNGLLALQQRATTVRLQLSRRIPNRTPPPVVSDTDNPTGLSGVDPESVVDAIRNRNQEIKDTIRANRTDFFFTYNSDWTAFVSNHKTDDLTAAAKSDTSATISYKTARSSEVGDIESFVDSNIIPPILATQAVTQANSIAVSDNLFRSLSVELLMFNRIHPAEALATKQNSIISAARKSTGVKSGFRRSHAAQNNQTAYMLESAINTFGTIIPLTYTSIPKDSVISVPNLTVETVVNVTERLEIPKSLLGNSPYYLVCDLIDDKGNLIQRETRLIEHGKNISAAFTPKVPSSIKATSAGLGRNIIEVWDDDHAYGVKLYRRVERTSSASRNSEYAFVGKIDYLDFNTKRRIVSDLCDNYNPVIYRAFPVGQDGSVGCVFTTSTTTAPSIPVGMEIPSLNKKKFASIHHEITNQGIQVTISDIPAGTIEIQLLRKDFMQDGSPELPIGKRQFLGDMRSELVVTDSGVYQDHIYEYRCQFFDRYGNVDDSSTIMTVEYAPEISSFISTVINNPKAIDGNELDVTFDIQTNFVPEPEEQIRRSLETHGLLSYFGNDITPARLQQLTAYNVVRTNLSTGEVEDFGIVTEKQFSDITLGRPKGVTQLRNGDQYRYTVTTFLRDPNTILRGRSVTARDPKFPNNPNRSYTYDPFFWKHPLALKRGTLTTDDTIQTITAKTDFTLGEVGSVVNVNISLASILPGIIEPIASKVNVINPKIIRISWRITGLATKFDHFMVMQEHLGMATRIGCCGNITSNNTFEFFDELTNDEEGELGYIIIPVYYNYSVGKSVNTNKVIV